MAPTSSFATSCGRGSDFAVEACVDMISTPTCWQKHSVPARHRIVVGVQDPALLLREVDARRAEDVDELVVAGVHGARGVDRGWRNDRDRRRAAVLVIVLAPH